MSSLKKQLYWYDIRLRVQHGHVNFYSPIDNQIKMNDLAWIVSSVWQDLPRRLDYIRTDMLQILPKACRGLAQSPFEITQAMQTFRQLSAQRLNQYLGQSFHDIWEVEIEIQRIEDAEVEIIRKELMPT